MKYVMGESVVRSDLPDRGSGAGGIGTVHEKERNELIAVRVGVSKENRRFMHGSLPGRRMLSLPKLAYFR